MRKMTWVLIGWCVLIVIWAAAGTNSAQKNCHATTKLQQDACDAGTGIGIAAVLFVGFIGFVFLALIWFMTRPREVVYAAPAPPSQPQAAPNWYPDPQAQGQLRYWDGSQWTHHTAPR